MLIIVAYSELAPKGPSGCIPGFVPSSPLACREDPAVEVGDPGILFNTAILPDSDLLPGNSEPTSVSFFELSGGLIV